LNAHNDSFYLGLKSWDGLYRFECGMNASVLKINEYFESKQELLNHLDLYYEKIINDLYSILENSKSHMQNILSKVYSSTGSSFLILDAEKDDYYYDEYGYKMNLKNTDGIHHYYILLVQHFSTEN
jgi:hypothetical protein